MHWFDRELLFGATTKQDQGLLLMSYSSVSVANEKAVFHYEDHASMCEQGGGGERMRGCDSSA